MALGSNVLEQLFVKISADTTGLTKGFATAEASTGAFATKFGSQMKMIQLAVAGVGLAIAGFSIKAAMDMEELYAKIQAGTGATGQDMEDLKKVFKDVGGSVEISLSDTAGIITELNTRLGITGDELTKLAGKIAEVADMMGVDATNAAIELTKTMNAWNIPNAEASLLLDKLFVASQKTGIGIDNLSSQLNVQGAFLRSVGLNLDDAIVLMAGFEKAGIRGEATMMALSMAARNFADQGRNIASAFVETVQQIKEATTAEEALNVATDVFGSRGAVTLVDAIRAGNFEFTELKAAIIEAQGSVDEFAESTETTGDKFKELKNQITLAAAELGEAFLPMLVKVMGMITPIVKGIANWIEANPRLIDTIIKLGLALGGLLLVLKMVAIMKAVVLALSGPAGWTMLAVAGGILLGLGLTMGNLLGNSGAKQITAENPLIVDASKEPQVTEYFAPELKSYQHGGIVPGPIGQPVPIMAHGGEMFLGEGGMPNVNVYVQGSVWAEHDLAEVIRNELIKTKRRNYDTGV
ncbi:MAG: phage tail tape measure protein [Dehalococcoidales bacterium]|nr:phage tail tape measure protein [Dehalococcoidales bacterium]